MNLSFEPLPPSHASDIVSWRYEAPYDLYNYADADREKAIDYLIDERNRFFAVLDEGCLVGFRSFGKDGRVDGGSYDDSYLDTGGGSRPDLTGKGLGAEIIEKGLQFGSEQFETERFRITVAAFNERALKVHRRIGFQEDHRFPRKSDGMEFVVLVIDKLKENLRASVCVPKSEGRD